ncbi:MAG: CoB--CoM heterodisulfide reductase iron-sulfur subunit B family protein [Chloroflexi bacterium]|nr:CoB--CoM heterodisulfide reductase iron-sulfur subunit B family protein [Chloroflexota bacterium]
MEVSLYPGCALEGTAREYRESLDAVSGMLGVELKELPDWVCCGASSAHVTNDKLAVSLAAKNIEIAEKYGRDVVVPCAACFHRLKVAENHLLEGKPLEGYSGKFQGQFKIKDMVVFFWENVGEKAVREKVKKPLDGLNAVCYYGCLVARPPKITGARNPENPMEMDRLVKALGATVKNWSFKTECCGGSLMLTRPDIAHRMTRKLLDMAEEAGAECIVVSCPLCQSNLDVRQREISSSAGRTYSMPVYYFSELMGVAYGNPSASKWLARHITEAKSLLAGKGLI